MFVQHEEVVDVDELAIVTDRSPFNDPIKVELADAIAAETDASIRFVFAVPESASEELVETVAEYHDELDDLCTVPVISDVIRTDDEIADRSAALGTADLVMLSPVTHRRLPDLFFEQRSDRLAAAVDQPVLLVHSKQTRRGTFLRPILDRLLFD